MTEKILVRLIDGTISWVPVNGKQVDETTFEILEDEEYLCDDPSMLFNFYPGDIVEVEDSFDEICQFRAVKLIAFSNRADRKYFYFKFKGTLREMSTSVETAREFKQEIDRIKTEMEAGQFMYRGIRETINSFDIERW